MLPYRTGLLVAVGGTVMFLICITALLSTMRPIALKHVSPLHAELGKTYIVPKVSTPIQPLLPIDEPSDDEIWTIQNRTLGFQKIYAISMPHRTDKRDYLAIMGLVSDMDITFVDGVNGSKMHLDAIPPYWKGSATVGELGCWRAHMDVYQHMLRNRVQSALILEDDADWDVFLRPQLLDLARGVRLLQNSTRLAQSPFGDQWDVLTIGHTGINNRLDDQTYWVTRNDPTVITERKRTWGRRPNLSAPALRGKYSRIVLQVYKLTGTAAYAISLRGATRMLYDQVLLPNAASIDVAISDMCRRNAYVTPFCYGTYPMLIGRYRAMGPKTRDSDRRTSSNTAVPGSGGGQSHADRLQAESEFTMFPVSLNAGRLLRGATVVAGNDELRNTMKEADLKTFVLPRGETVWVGRDEYVRVKTPQVSNGN